MATNNGKKSGENINVVCRVRPCNEEEKRDGNASIVDISDNTVFIKGKQFQFDVVFGPDSSQEDVYLEVASPIVRDLLSGYNGTIFAYGQTSSGKTHTMEGLMNDGELPGIIPRIVDDIFAHIAQMSVDEEFNIKVAYYEIYNENVNDLLNVRGKDLVINEGRDKIPYIKDLTEVNVDSPELVMSVMEEGKSNRHVGVTNMNAHSSRSHSVFVISITQYNMITKKKLSGKLSLVDLAGSERAGKTGATGNQLKEAANINTSLWALGNVISGLSEGSSHIPYRNSKLTRILQQSLGGNSRTTIVLCASPAASNSYETTSTFKFGQRARKIENVVRVNVEVSAEEWRKRYDEEKKNNKILLSLMVEELTAWRAGERVPPNRQVKLPAVGMNAASSSDSQTDTPSPISSVLEKEREKWEEERLEMIETHQRELQEQTQQKHALENEYEQLQVYIIIFIDKTFHILTSYFYFLFFFPIRVFNTTKVQSLMYTYVLIAV